MVVVGGEAGSLARCSCRKLHLLASPPLDGKAEGARVGHPGATPPCTGQAGLGGRQVWCPAWAHLPPKMWGWGRGAVPEEGWAPHLGMEW